MGSTDRTLSTTPPPPSGGTTRGGRAKKPAAPAPSVEAETKVEGCLKCGHDDDHANLLLCEGCNDEYHTYCLQPPLRAVPEGDWFCGKTTIYFLQYYFDFCLSFDMKNHPTNITEPIFFFKIN
jgi:hypothetical protein